MPSPRAERAAPAARAPQWIATWGAAVQQATDDAQDGPNWSRKG
ncbi:hypothetical protein AB0D83_34955 [Streptomyces decoyicus]